MLWATSGSLDIECESLSNNDFFAGLGYSKGAWLGGISSFELSGDQRLAFGDLVGGSGYCVDEEG